MRCFFILSVALLAFAQLSGQKNKSKEEDWDKTFTKTELDAQTDQRAWAAYIRKAAVLPDSVTAKMAPGNYAVTVQFVVDVNGNLAYITATNNPGYGLAGKAEKIVAEYDGQWKPANQCGRAVKSYKKQVITFVVKQ